MQSFIILVRPTLFFLLLVTLFLGSLIGPSPVFSKQKNISRQTPFTIVLLPDTQYYNELVDGSRRHIFDIQTQWIASHVNDLNIVLTLHVGDIVEYSTEKQLKNAKESLGYLDEVVPYIVTIGNHDILWTNFPRPHRSNRPNNRKLFHKIFPPSLYKKMPSFGGIFKNEGIENSFHFFEFGETQYMIITLEHRPNDEILAWANQITAQYPDKQVIVLTHEYVETNDTLVTPYGENVWEKFVKKHSNIKFVFSGHVKGPGKLISKGNNGNSVFQIGSNYQFGENGGNGFLRLLKFYPKEQKIMVKTFSPLLNEYKTDRVNQFLIDLKNNIFSYEIFDRKTKGPQDRILKRDKNGKLSSMWSYKDGKLEGETKLFYPGESIKATIDYSNGLPIKTSTYHPNGQLNFAGSFLNGILEGDAKRFYDTGDLMHKGFYAKGQLNGLRRTFYPNGNRKEEKYFKNNHAEGPVKNYYESGNLKEDFILKTECKIEWCLGKIDGLWKEYHENGKLKSNITYVMGYEHGPAEFYSAKGFLEMERTYYRNKTNGLVKNYYSNLNIRSIQNVKSKIIKSPAILFYEEGGIKNIFYYKDNKLHGSSYNFDPQGRLIVEWNYINGKREGISKKFNASGGKATLPYSNDKLNGLAKQFDPNGKLISINRFKNDILQEVIPIK